MSKELTIIVFVFVFLVSIFLMQVPSTTSAFAPYPTNLGIGFAYGIFGTLFLVILASRLSGRKTTFKDRQEMMEIEKEKMIYEQFDMGVYLKPLREKLDYVSELYTRVDKEVQLRADPDVKAVNYKLIKERDNIKLVYDSLKATIEDLEINNDYQAIDQLSNAWSQSRSIPHPKLTEDLYMLTANMKLRGIEKYTQLKKLRKDMTA